MTQKQQRFWIWLFLALLWMAIIFIKSSESYGEQDLRPQFAAWISEDRLQHILPKIEFTYGGGLVTYHKPYDMLEFFLRKSAHMFEFGLLAFLLTMVLRHRMKSRGLALLLASLLSCLYAISDEWHQTFVPDRTGHAIDVAVDATGILIFAVLYLGIASLQQLYRSRRR